MRRQNSYFFKNLDDCEKDNIQNKRIDEEISSGYSIFFFLYLCTRTILMFFIMKRIFPVFLYWYCFRRLLLSSCKGKDPTIGTLTITVMTKDGSISGVTDSNLLATSKEISITRICSLRLLDSNNPDLPRLLPTYYWYRVEGWDDYGAAEVTPDGWIGYLVVNSPLPPGNN